MRSYFSLRNKEGLGPFKSMVTKPQHAIYRGSGYGPLFGLGYDIYIANNANSNTISSREHYLFVQGFTPTLFQVEYKAVQQSWLGLTTSHLTTGKCFTLQLVKSPQDQFYQQCFTKFTLI